MLLSLALLYTSQGVPFGFASEYLPVKLRQAHFSMGQIALLGWLQLPWQLKILWARAADGATGRRHGRALLLALQMALAAATLLFAIAPLSSAPRLWFGLTFLCALLASSQDVFVDAMAVRTLGPAQLGLGNTAQVAGYRLGILVGGAGLLLVSGPLGERLAIAGCALLVALASLGAFRLGAADADAGPAADSAATSRPVGALLRQLVAPRAWPVLALALSYKLGLHMASVLLKPMAVDAGWSQRDIGLAVVTVGISMALLGSAVGGVLHRAIGERRALLLAGLAQAAVCLPLLLAERRGAPLGWTTVAIGAEHLASGIGTTVLFAALMSATRRADAGLHYTALTSANVIAIFAGSTAGGLLADALGRAPVFALSALVCLLPLRLLRGWERAAAASAGE